LLPSEGPGQKYYRFQAPLAHGVGGLDCADPWSVQCLIDHAEALIEDQEDQINNLCEKLRPDGF
ncbi:MAG: patatin, partial [Chlamydiia bacterium]|nr:patatin [Chlamydiia bacterium]